MNTKQSTAHTEFAVKTNNIDFSTTEEIHDHAGNLRLYCTQFPSRFNLQIRYYTDLKKPRGNRGNTNKNLIATISLSDMDIIRMAEFVKNYK